MPASGKKDVMSDAEHEQREQAARKHGAFAFRDRGEDALQPTQRSRLVEINEQLQERPGLVALAQDRALKAIMICEILESYVTEEAQSGKPVHEIPALKVLPAFWNSAQRALAAVIALTPDRKNVVDAAHVLEVIEHERRDKKTD
jgi:hypothetical protein